LNRFLTSSFGINAAYGTQNYEYDNYEHTQKATYVQSNFGSWGNLVEVKKNHLKA
jgi:hypothetical protein